MKLAISLSGLGILLGLFYFLTSGTPVVFQSLESVTETGAPVYNRVRLLPGWNRDIWLMQQSHHGLDAEFGKWDRLAIVVDKTTRPYRADFYQLAPGELAYEDAPVPLKARCFACHANGPRAVRPDFDSPNAGLNLASVLRTAVWNLRIRGYGRVESRPGHTFQDGVPFKSTLSILSRPLELGTCSHCHAPDGDRGELKLEHLGTALFMIERGFMPPAPYRISEEERERLLSNAGSGPTRPRPGSGPKTGAKSHAPWSGAGSRRHSSAPEA
jgi:hypothetical protein